MFDTTAGVDDGSAQGNRPRILLLTTSLLVDRLFVFTDLIKDLSEQAKVTVWASSFSGASDVSIWSGLDAKVETFPKVDPFRERHNYLRRLNEFTWDYRYQLTSRMSMMEHVREKQFSPMIRALRPVARTLASVRGEEMLEMRLEKLLSSYPRSDESVARLRAARPDLIVTTGPFQFEQPGVVTAAKKFGIPCLAYIPSWDNVTTKNRLVFSYDGYIVWNEQIKKELHDFYPRSREVPVYVVGAGQFDVFHQKRFEVSREQFCLDHGLDPTRPVILYAVGSPNFLKEHHGAIDLAKRVAAGRLGDAQLVVRPHPLKDNSEMVEMFKNFGSSVHLQLSPEAGKDLTKRTQDESQIREWINTFRHADVVVNLSSTVTVDAAIFDKPVVNLDFDPQPSKEDQNLIKDINHKWHHFKPIAESGGVWLVNDFDELEHAVKSYLQDPSQHREKRRWIAEYVCGFVDGKCGSRMADAITEFVTESGLVQPK